MKKITFSFIFYIAGFCLFASKAFSGTGVVPSLCTIGGVATASQEAICDNSSTFLYLTGYNGNIQWQSYNGTAWINETGTGFNADTFQVSPLVTTDYRAFVTFPSCPDTMSNVITITVGLLPSPVGTGGTRCGYGTVSLSAAGTGTLRWFTDSLAGTLVDTGTTITPTVFNTTTFYVESTSGGGNAAPLTTTFAGGNGFDGNMFDIEAINQVTITAFDGNLTNAPGIAEIWYRSGSYVGFANSNAGWTFVDSVSMTGTNGNGVATPIAINVNVTIPAGQKYAFYVHYSGSVDYTNGVGSPTTITTQDANIKVFEGSGGGYFAVGNTPRIFNGVIHYSSGCASPRIPVVATVSQPDPVTITSGANALCLGDSTTLTASSVNASYSYVWSPATGLNVTSGAVVTANPATTVTYVVIGDDGTCADVDSLTIDVGPTSVAGLASTISDTVCSGSNTLLILSGSTGNIQWQSNTGSGWVNETGIGNDSAYYMITPTVLKTYRAFVVSGGCPADSTNILSVSVITVNLPTVLDSTRCGPGTLTLSAAGNGTLLWYSSASGGSIVNVGPVYMPNLTTTTTYYVENSAGPGVQHIGPVNAGIGGQTYTAANNYGIQFDVAQTVTLEQVYVYPAVDGIVTINLRQTQGGPILSSASVPVVAGGKTPIPLGFVISPGTNYRLELANTSPNCQRNTTGAIWPYDSTGIPVTLTANLIPNANTGATYYFFYDWEVNAGCKSSRVPVTATINAVPPVPVITPNGNQLSSSSATGNQWYLNGNILTGETNQTLQVLTSGSYTVTVTSNGCESTSTPFIFNSIPDQGNSMNSWIMFPNPGSGLFTFQMTGSETGNMQLKLVDLTGKVIMQANDKFTNSFIEKVLDLRSLMPGMYLMEMNLAGNRSLQKLIINH